MAKNNVKVIKNLNYFFNEVPLYKKEKFDIFYKDEFGFINLNDDAFKSLCEYLGFGQDKIITTCNECDYTFPFDVRSKFQSEYSSETSSYIYVSNDSYLSFGYSRKFGLVESGQRLTKDNIFPYSSGIINYSFVCNNYRNHIYNMSVLLEVKNLKIYVMKVGANPSIHDVKGFDFDRYKKFLEKTDAVEDYKKAELSYADGYYVGSFAYLRRVFEKMINYYLDIVDERPESNKSEDKIKVIKKLFDSRINSQLTNLYAILSQGIHELEEDECEEYYIFLKGIIDMQLLYEKNNEEVEEQTKFFSNSVSNIATKLKSKIEK